LTVKSRKAHKRMKWESGHTCLRRGAGGRYRRESWSFRNNLVSIEGKKRFIRKWRQEWALFFFQKGRNQSGKVLIGKGKCIKRTQRRYSEKDGIFHQKIYLGGEGGRPKSLPISARRKQSGWPFRYTITRPKGLSRKLGERLEKGMLSPIRSAGGERMGGLSKREEKSGATEEGDLPSGSDDFNRKMS